MESNVDSSEQRPLKSAQFNNDEQVIVNQGFTADNNCVTDINNLTKLIFPDSDNCTDSYSHGYCSSVDLQHNDTSLQKHNYNKSVSTENVKISNQTIAAQSGICVNNPPDLHFLHIDMNVDIEGKGPTAAAAVAGTMNIVAPSPTGTVNNTSGSVGVGGAGPRSRTSPPSCQDQMSSGDNYPSGPSTTMTQQLSSSSYAAEFDPLAMATGSSGNGQSDVNYARGYGAEGGASRGLDRYGELGACSGNGARENQVSAVAIFSGGSRIGGNGSGSEKAAYELLDREMRYMLKFADPDQNLASMDELIQSGVDLLDLLPPEEGGVKPRFSNPSNDWKYDIIAKYVDACNPVSECTCHHYDGRRHDIHLCSVHHDTVSQDSDTLTMDTEGSLVNIPIIKLHSTFTDNGKSDYRNNNSTTGDNTSSSTSSTTTTNHQAHSQQQDQNPHTKSNIIDKSAQCQNTIRTEADNKEGGGGNIVVGYDASFSQSSPAGGRDLQGQSVCNEDSSGDKSSADRSLVHTANHTHQYYGVDERTATSNSTNNATSVQHSTGHDNPGIPMDLDSAQGPGHGDDPQNVDKNDDADGVQNATVFAEVHVDATAMKYDEPSQTDTGDAGGRRTQQSAIQGRVNELSSADGSHDPINDNVHESGSDYSDNGSGKDKQESSPTKNTPSSTSPPSSHQQANNDTGKSTPATSDVPAVAKNNPDSTISTSSPAESSSPTSREDASTSVSKRKKENYEKFLSRPPTTSVQDHRKRAFTKRPSLPIEPRTTQYQKHALLQERSDTGVLEFELLLAERFEDEQRARRDSLNSRKCSLDSSRLKLMPRTNQYEPHPLLRKTNSGMSEIEEVLQEKNRSSSRK